jgi:hypothetical protein
MVGLGPKSGFSASSLRTAIKTATASVLGAGVTKAAIEFFQAQGVQSGGSIPALREGLAEGAAGRSLTVSLLAPDETAYKELSRFSMT